MCTGVHRCRSPSNLCAAFSGPAGHAVADDVISQRTWKEALFSLLMRSLSSLTSSSPEGGWIERGRSLALFRAGPRLPIA